MADETEELAIVPQFHAVAVNATEMASARVGIKTWLESKVLSIDAEIAQTQESLDYAIKHKWKTVTFRGQLQRLKQKSLYYQKLLAAVHAGFTIVPNMPVDVFAIRVKRERPAESAYGEEKNYHPYLQLENETEQRLPIGKGRYENPVQMVKTYKGDTTNKAGETVKFTEIQAVDFAELEFPMAVAHPLVMDATGQAMALKIFDRIGLVSERGRPKGDPIVLGQITRKIGWETKTASFLIAWYLDPRTL